MYVMIGANAKTGVIGANGKTGVTNLRLGARVAVVFDNRQQRLRRRSIPPAARTHTPNTQKRCHICVQGLEIKIGPGWV